jgi:hypothetical protein
MEIYGNWNFLPEMTIITICGTQVWLSTEKGQDLKQYKA